MRSAGLGRDAICIENTSSIGETAGTRRIEGKVFLLMGRCLQGIERLAELPDLVAVCEIVVEDDRGEKGRVQWRTVKFF